MEEIVNHPNYKGLPIKKKADGSYTWIATAKSETGQKRIHWCIQKAQELGLTKTEETYPGMYADVMLKIHPTKWKVCQICGKKMSLYYHYPNANFLKALNQKFGTSFLTVTISAISGMNSSTRVFAKMILRAFLINKGKLNLDAQNSEKHEIIAALEHACRKGDKKYLGKELCRTFLIVMTGSLHIIAVVDLFRIKVDSKENLKSYTKDRRAYEYWSDGNIHEQISSWEAASLMVYPLTILAQFLWALSTTHATCSLCLREIILQNVTAYKSWTIESIIETEQRTGIYPMSWQSRLIWEFIKANYSANPDKVPTVYRDALKQNMANFMFILRTILENCPNKGETFACFCIFRTKFLYFQVFLYL